MTTTPDRLDNAPWPGAQENWVDEVRDAGTGKKSFPLSQEAINWLLPLTNSVNAAPQQVGDFIDLDNQTAAIAPVDFVGGDIVTGLYLLALWARVELPDAVSSSVQVTITYVSGGVIQTFVGTLVNGNTPTSKDQQIVPLWIDEGSSVTYETSYASNTPNTMAYALSIALQLIKGRT